MDIEPLINDEDLSEEDHDIRFKQAKPEVIASQRSPSYPDVVASQSPSIVLPPAPQLQHESYEQREDQEQQLTVGEAVAYSSAMPIAHQLNDPVAITTADSNHIQDCSPKRPKDYSGIAWLSLLFCFFPLSIPAVYYSDQVIKSIRKNDIIRARKQSYLAKKFATLAIIFGIAILTLVIVTYFIVKFVFHHS